MEQETQYFDCYTVNPSDEPSIDVNIDFSLVLHNIDEALLARVAARSSSISLVIVNALTMPTSAVALIVQHISPKLRKLVLTDCNALTWGDVKPMLAAAGALEHIDLRRNAWMDDYVMVISFPSPSTLSICHYITSSFFVFCVITCRIS